MESTSSRTIQTEYLLFEHAADLLPKDLEVKKHTAACKACLWHDCFSAEEIDAHFEINPAPDVIGLPVGAGQTLQAA